MGDIVGVRVLMRTNKGELVQAQEIVLLNKTWPLPEKFHGLTDQETRYRQRYVDLTTNADSRKVFQARSQTGTTYVSSSLSTIILWRNTHDAQYSCGPSRPFITHHNTGYAAVFASRPRVVP